MGWGFRKSKKILPGVRATLSHRGLGLRVGGRHAGVSVTPAGARVSGSIPGTGVSFRNEIGTQSEARDESNLSDEEVEKGYDDYEYMHCENTLEGYWLEPQIKLGKAIKTPMGSNVTLLEVCVDVDYKRSGTAIELVKIRLAKNGANARSVMKREGFRISEIENPAALVEAAHRDLYEGYKPLRNRILGHSYRNGSKSPGASKIMSAILLPIYLVGFLVFAGLGLALVLQPDTPFKILGGVFWLIALVCGLKTRSRLKAFR